MWRGAKRGSALPAVLAAALVHPLAAQNADAPRAPRIIDAPSSAAPAPPRRPGSFSAAANRAASRARQPAAAERGAARAAARCSATTSPRRSSSSAKAGGCPDLGSEWRARQKEAASAGRFSATALPLYDPAEPPLHSDAFTSHEQRRHGYIELFRLRFGRRSRD